MNWFLLQDNPTTQAWIATHSGLGVISCSPCSASTLPRATFAKFTGDGTYVVTTTDNKA